MGRVFTHTGKPRAVLVNRVSKKPPALLPGAFSTTFSRYFLFGAGLGGGLIVSTTVVFGRRFASATGINLPVSASRPIFCPLELMILFLQFLGTVSVRSIDCKTRTLQDIYANFCIGMLTSIPWVLAPTSPYSVLSLQGSTDYGLFYFRF